VLVAAVCGQDPDGGRPGPGVSSSPLTSLQRLVRHFDFEELAERPSPMPDLFHRVGEDADGGTSGASYGFPRFGTMALVDDVAANGRGSFMFELDGGSMAARTPTAVLPVLPNRHYVVRTMVRTQGLKHAGARLEAWLHAADGTFLGPARVVSRLARTRGRWEVLTVEVKTGADAADLVVELAVLQPRQLGAARLPAHGPVMEDLRGRVWFDDLVIWNVPRLDVETRSAGNVITATDDLTLHIHIRDLATHRLRGEAIIRNVNGDVVHATTFVPPPHDLPYTIDLSHLNAGWYEAQVELSEAGDPVARRFGRFHIAAPLVNTPDPMFGVRLEQTRAPDEVLVASLGCGSAMVTLGDIPDELSEESGSAHVIEQLLESKRRLTLAIRAESVDTPTAEIDLIVRRFGHRIRHWQLGTLVDLESGLITSGTPSWLETLEETWGSGTASITLVSPWSAEFEAGEWAGPGGLNVVVPYAAPPHTMATMAATWTRPDADLLVSLEQPPGHLYAPQAQVVDLMLRGLHAWRAGLPRLLIDAPWTRTGTDGRPEPTPAFGAWRTLADRLTGRHFVAELPLGEGVHGWLIEGADEQSAAIVAWTEDPSRHDRLQMYLGRDRVEAIDAYGNARHIPLEGQIHDVPISEMPIFIEGIDTRLARFRVAFAIDPPHVQSAHRVQERAIVLTNPWDVPLTGTARVDDGGTWRIDLPRTEFAIDPGQTVRLPLTFTPRRNSLAGLKTLRCQLRLQADQTYEITASTTLDLGLNHLEMIPKWQLETDGDRSTLVVHITVRNIGTDISNVDTFLYAPGMGTQNRPIGPLAPGQTAVRVFRLGDAAAVEAGAIAYVGVDERDGAARLTQAMPLPQIAPGGGLSVQQHEGDLRDLP
jgi:hypothetical protein